MQNFGGQIGFIMRDVQVAFVQNTPSVLTLLSDTFIYFSYPTYQVSYDNIVIDDDCFFLFFNAKSYKSDRAKRYNYFYGADKRLG